jgi:hypothetical protein
VYSNDTAGNIGVSMSRYSTHDGWSNIYQCCTIMAQYDRGDLFRCHANFGCPTSSFGITKLHCELLQERHTSLSTATDGDGIAKWNWNTSGNHRRRKLIIFRATYQAALRRYTMPPRQTDGMLLQAIRDSYPVADSFFDVIYRDGLVPVVWLIGLSTHIHSHDEGDSTRSSEMLM